MKMVCEKKEANAIKDMLKNCFPKLTEPVGEIIKNSKVSLKEKERQETKFYSDFKVLFNKRNKLNEVMQSKDLGLSREEEKINPCPEKFCVKTGEFKERQNNHRQH